MAKILKGRKKKKIPKSTVSRICYVGKKFVFFVIFVFGQIG